MYSTLSEFSFFIQLLVFFLILHIAVLDAMSGFHQLKLNENSNQFTRLSFGLTNTPQKLKKKVMNIIMTGLTYRINCCYLDDCVCFGKPFEEHLNALEITFDQLLKLKLKLKISKCEFGYTELKLLDNIINGRGIKPTEEGLLAIEVQEESIKKVTNLINHNYSYTP